MTGSSHRPLLATIVLTALTVAAPATRAVADGYTYQFGVDGYTLTSDTAPLSTSSPVLCP